MPRPGLPNAPQAVAHPWRGCTRYRLRNGLLVTRAEEDAKTQLRAAELRVIHQRLKARRRRNA